MLPNLIIGGAPKCGTTSLHGWLEAHPQVTGSSVKETFYFVDPSSDQFRPHANFRDHGFEGFAQFFTETEPGASLCIESTTLCLYSQTALNHLPDLPSRPKFLFMVREPSRQLYSNYQFFTNKFPEIDPRTSFADFIDQVRRADPRVGHVEQLRHALDYANYEKHLSRWRDRVGADRIAVHVFEDMIKDPRVFARKLAVTYGIEPDFFDSYAFDPDNQTTYVRSWALKSLGRKLRAILPAGRALEGLRSVYHAINSSKARPEMSAQDEATLAALKAEFADANQRLAREFDLDLSRWAAR